MIWKSFKHKVRVNRGVLNNVKDSEIFKVYRLKGLYACLQTWKFYHLQQEQILQHLIYIYSARQRLNITKHTYYVYFEILNQITHTKWVWCRILSQNSKGDLVYKHDISLRISVYFHRIIYVVRIGSTVSSPLYITHGVRSLYLQLIRSNLGYASQIWCRQSVEHIRSIEKVQRRATKNILYLGFFSDISYSARLNLLPISYWHARVPRCGCSRQNTLISLY